MATTLLFSTTGTLTPGSGGNTFDITDPSLFKSIHVEFTADTDHAYVMHQDYAGTGWLLLRDDSGTPVKLTNKRPSVIIGQIGTYALSGNISGTITAYTESL